MFKYSYVFVLLGSVFGIPAAQAQDYLNYCHARTHVTLPLQPEDCMLIGQGGEVRRVQGDELAGNGGVVSVGATGAIQTSDGSGGLVALVPGTGVAGFIASPVGGISATWLEANAAAVNLGYTPVSTLRAINTAGLLTGGGNLASDLTLSLASVPASTIMGNPTTGSAAPTTITLGSGLSFTGTVLNASGTASTGSVGAIQTSNGSGGFNALVPGTGVAAFVVTPVAGIPATWLQANAAATNLGFTPPPNTRLINTGTGLTGGGNLTADRTIALAAGAALANLGFTPVADTRIITTGTGLTGGGDLSSDRTIALAAGAAVANLGFTPPPNTRTITPSGLLTGGGDLSANRTITMAAAAASTLLGNPTTSTAVPTTITLGSNLSFSGGVLNASTGGSAFAVGPAGAIQTTDGSSNFTSITPGTGVASFLATPVAGVQASWLAAGAAVANLGFTPVTNARTITPSGLLTGGGDLTANRTITMATAAAHTLLGNPTSSTAVPVVVTIGPGLSFTGTTIDTNATTSAGASGALQTSDGSGGFSSITPGTGVSTFIATPVGNVLATWLATGAAATNLGFTPPPNTRSVATSGLLSGGGNLTADRTITMASVAANTLLANATGSSAAPTAVTLGAGLSFSGGTLVASGTAAAGGVGALQTSDGSGNFTSITPGTGVATFLAVPVGNVQASWLAAGAAVSNLGFTPVTNARTVSTSGLLTGGGDLSANRTISMAAMAANTLAGNPTGSSAVPIAITLGTNLSFSGGVLNAAGGGSSSSGASGALQTSDGSGGFTSITPGTGVAAFLATPVSNVLATWLASGAAQTNLGYKPDRVSRTVGTDTNTTIGATSRYVSLGTSNWTVPATYTLPAISTLSDGDIKEFADDRLVLAGQTLTLAANVADTIGGAISMNTAGGRIYCRASSPDSAWTCWGGISNSPVSGQVLIGQGPSAPGNWVTLSGDVGSLDNLGAFKLSKLNGVAYPNFSLTNRMLYSTGSNDMTGQILPVNGAMLNTSSGGVPSETITPLLGVPGTSVGTISFGNATSGQVTISPATGALGSAILTLPAATDTLVGKATTDTLTNKTINGASNTLTVRAASDVTGQLPKVSGGTAGTTGLAAAKNLSVVYKVAEDFSAHSHTGDNTETQMTSCAIPAGAIGAGGLLRVTTFATRPASQAGTVTWKWYLSTANDLTGTFLATSTQAVATRSNIFTATVFNRTTGSQLGLGGTTVAALTSSIDTTASTWLVLSGQNATTTDTFQVEAMSCEIVPPGGN